jgi:hypothetical protein
MEASVRATAKQVIVVLEYPNGRSHEQVLRGTLTPGAEFDLYGRRWQVVGLAPKPRHHRGPDKLLCRSGARVASFLGDPRD